MPLSSWVVVVAMVVVVVEKVQEVVEELTKAEDKNVYDFAYVLWKHACSETNNWKNCDNLNNTN